jgi:glycosyltransferase involved in cell wall biosynthesis
MENPWEDLQLAEQWVKSVYEKIKPDLIHFNNYGLINSKWPCPVVTVFHSCVQTWWRAVKGENAPLDWDKYRYTVKKAIFLSDVLVAPSRAILNEAQKIYGKTEVAKVIYNGSYNGNYIKIEDKEPFVLTAGRVWDKAKNICILSEIAESINWPIYIAGNNVNPSNGTVRTPQNVFFLGQLSHNELQIYMQKASLFVMPARYEPFGLAILEAAQAGCALALGQIGTLQEIWQDAALYFKPDDETKIIETLQKLITNPDLRIKMSIRSYLRAKFFTVERMTWEYITLYKGLLKQRQSTTGVSV